MSEGIYNAINRLILRDIVASGLIGETPALVKLRSCVCYVAIPVRNNGSMLLKSNIFPVLEVMVIDI